MRYVQLDELNSLSHKNRIEKAQKEVARLEAIKQREKREEAERARRLQLLRQRETLRLALLGEIKNWFERDYFGAEPFFHANCTDLISREEFDLERISFVSSWINQLQPRNHKVVRHKLDDEQLAAVSDVIGYIQVVARAGSGKTSTLVNRAFFLQKHCGVKPSEMMLLAFNKKAAEEIEERLGKLLDDDPPFVMTFHALAYALLSPVNFGLILDSAFDSFVQDVIDNHLRDPAFIDRIGKVMIAHFKEDWDRIEQGGYHLSPEEMLEYRRALQRETLRGEFVKSYGEKVIANFLFEHQVPYLYEPLERGKLKNYHPDFLITRGDRTGVAIEYFGMMGDPDYDEMSAAKRQYWEGKLGWILIELAPEDINPRGLVYLQEELENAGFACKRMTEIEIWQQVQKPAIDRFSMVTRSFIARCRKLELTPESLQQEIAGHKTKWQVEADFLDIMVPIYRDYLERLDAVGNEDFDGLMQRAARAIDEGKTTFSRNKGKQNGDLAKLRFMLIDEYQDFSKLFHSMVEAIRRRNPTLQLFCVGDDWQAINGFAGSDLKYYEQFQGYFPDAKPLHISTNYRSAAGIVAVGNAVMAGQDAYGKPALAHSTLAGNVWLADVNEFVASPTEEDRHGADRITPMVLRIFAQALAKDKDVVLLSRNNDLRDRVNYKAYQGDEGNSSATGIERFRSLICSFFPEHQRYLIKASTTHKFKGLQGSVVVVLDAVAGCYPLIHQDWILLRVLGEDIDMITDESRRLFYVALTRAVDTLVIFTEKCKKSPFLEDVEKRVRLTPIQWDSFPPVGVKSDGLQVFVCNQFGMGGGPTYAVKDFLKQEGYDPSRMDGIGFAWRKAFSLDGFNIDDLKKSTWSPNADGVEVRIQDGQGNLVGNYRVDSGVWTELMPLVLPE
jgi:DNA helicase-4